MSLFLTTSVLGLACSTVEAQGTAFTYQGRLDSGTNPADGNYDLTFALFNASSNGTQVGSTLTNFDVSVSNGLFIVTEDFGAVYDGTAYWLQIGVRTTNGGAFTLLSPLQELTPAPYAVTAENVTGTIPLAQLPATIALLSDPGAPGSDNFFAGQNAGNVSLSGTGNTGMGADALINDGTGTDNTAYGIFALYFNSTGSFNTADGADALEWNSTGSFNTATGYNAMANIPAYVTGSYNTADGVSALTSDDAGSNNTAIGVAALAENQNGSGNIALGYQAGYNITGGFNIDVGNVGAPSDNSIIRIGSGQTDAFIAGEVHLVDGLNIDQNGLNNGNVASNALTFGINSGEGIASKRNGTNPYDLELWTDFQNRMTILQGGSVGINTSSPSQALEVNGNFVQIDGANAYNGNGPIDAYIGGNGSGSDVQIGSMNSKISNVALYNWGNSNYMHLYCSSITIEGGSDLAEPFAVSSPSGEIPDGSVVVIDEENPGHLKVSTQAYDTRVAGVLSGANGVNPGIQMQQQGLLEGGKNVALTGRVYVQADASYGLIKPGDLLTTSATPGHAMKVSNHARATGAILGKAMSGLKQGKGMVLVLVTLQ